jgi:hypothetical protein
MKSTLFLACIPDAVFSATVRTQCKFSVVETWKLLSVTSKTNKPIADGALPSKTGLIRVVRMTITFPRGSNPTEPRHTR